MIGTRGVPAAYGGFETAVEEVGRRLVERGHRVVVYTRGSESRETRRTSEWRSCTSRRCRRSSSRPSATRDSPTMHAIARRRPDAAFVFNAANAPFLPLLRARGIPTALHMDGLEWRRSKWGARGKAYYRWAEQFGVRWADALIADAPGIADYYDRPVRRADRAHPLRRARSSSRPPTDGIRGARARTGRLPPRRRPVRAREPRARDRRGLPRERCAGSRSWSSARRPTAPTTRRRSSTAAGEDPRIRFLGGVYDQDLLDALYLHAHTYVHGHSVGGTNPSLLRAMGAGTAVDRL